MKNKKIKVDIKMIEMKRSSLEVLEDVYFLELLIESIKEERGDYICELDNIFYENDEFVYYSDAEEFLTEYGVFDGINEVIEYEKANYGEVYVDVSNPCEVANRLFTIKACDYLHELQGNNKKIGKFMDDNWNEEFTPESRKELLFYLEVEYNGGSDVEYLKDTDFELNENIETWYLGDFDELGEGFMYGTLEGINDKLLDMVKSEIGDNIIKKYKDSKGNYLVITD